MATPDVHPPYLDEGARLALGEHLSNAVTVGVVCSVKTEHLRKAKSIVHYFETSLQHSRTRLIRSTDAQCDWLEKVKEEDCTKLIFVGLPPLPKRGLIPGRRGSQGLRPSYEQEFTGKGRWKLNDVVVIPEVPLMRSNRKSPEHFLERYPQLDYVCEPNWLAEAALSVIAGECVCVCTNLYVYQYV